MKVIEYRKPREGKKDKVWKEVKYSNQEWAIMMTGAALIAVLVSVVNNREYPTNLLGSVVFTLIMMAVFDACLSCPIWRFVSLYSLFAIFRFCLAYTSSAASFLSTSPFP